MAFLKYNERKRLAADVQTILVTKSNHFRIFFLILFLFHQAGPAVKDFYTHVIGHLPNKASQQQRSTPFEESFYNVS